MLRTGHLRPAVLGFALGTLSVAAYAEPMTYTIDSSHTYPSFEVDGKTAVACCIDEDSSHATLQATLSAVGRSGAVQERLRQAV